MLVDFVITNFKLRSSSDPVSWSALAYFDIALPGVEIRRCRLVRYDGRIVVRGPMYDRKRNRELFGEINFKAATYHAITAAAVKIFNQMSGGRLVDEAAHRDGDADATSAVLPFPQTRIAAHG